MNDRAGGGHRLQVAVQSESRQFRDAKLLAQDPLRVVALKNPILQARLHAAGAIEQGSLRGFKQAAADAGRSVSRGRISCNSSRNVFLGSLAGKFRGLKFTGGQIHHGQPNPASRGMFAQPPQGNYFPARPAPRTSVAVPGVMTRDTSRRTSFLPGPGCSICSQIAILYPARISRAM